MQNEGHCTAIEFELESRHAQHSATVLPFDAVFYKGPVYWLLLTKLQTSLKRSSRAHSSRACLIAGKHRVHVLHRPYDVVNCCLFFSDFTENCHHDLDIFQGIDRGTQLTLDVVNVLLTVLQ